MGIFNIFQKNVKVSKIQVKMDDVQDPKGEIYKLLEVVVQSRFLYLIYVLKGKGDRSLNVKRFLDN